MQSHLFLKRYVFVAAFLVVTGNHSQVLGQTKNTDIKRIVRNLTTCCDGGDFRSITNKQKAVSDLKQMLASPVEEAHWYKAILALGEVAPPTDDLARQMWNFLLSAEPFGAPLVNTVPIKEISENLAETKSLVPLGLGYLLSHSENTLGVLSSLIDGTDPKYWKERLKWSGISRFGNDEDQRLMVAIYCIKGLMLSQKAAAKDHIILKLRTNPPSSDLGYKEVVESAYCYVTKCRQ